MEVTISEENAVSVVVVTGRVDSNTAPDLERDLKATAEAASARVVVDLSAVDYISSAGLRALVSALRGARTQGGDVRLAALSPRVADVLKLAGLESIFAVYASREQAVASFVL